MPSETNGESCNGAVPGLQELQTIKSLLQQLEATLQCEDGVKEVADCPAPELRPVAACLARLAGAAEAADLRRQNSLLVAQLAERDRRLAGLQDRLGEGTGLRPVELPRPVRTVNTATQVCVNLSIHTKKVVSSGKNL